MKVNGKVQVIHESQSLLDFLLKKNYDISFIAVERNGEIVPKSTYEQVMLKDEDTLEIVNFVEGG